MYSDICYSDFSPMDRINLSASKENYEVYLEKLEELVLQHLPKGAHIFDLGCGRGQLAQLLQNKGYQVTGLDVSEMSLRDARENVPGVEFILDDVRYFKLPPTFHAVVSTDVVLNNIMSIKELESVFYNVYAALLENGLFAFDLNTEESYLSRWSVPVTSVQVKDDLAGILYVAYDPETKKVREDHIRFKLIKGEWQRSDVSIQRKCHSLAEVQHILEKVGFKEVSIYNVKQDLKVDRASGLVCFVCRKHL